LTASLLRSAPPPKADVAGSDKTLFVSKGKASAAQFRPAYLTTEIAPSDGAGFLFEHAGAASIARRNDARLWVRVATAVRLRVKMAADARGQNTRAFLDDVLDSALAAGASALTAPRTGTTGRSTKLAFTIDDEQRAAIQQAAARSNLTVQAFLRSAIEATLERQLADEPQLFAEGAPSKIIAFPRSGGQQRGGIDPQRRQRLQQAAARLGLTAFQDLLPPR
jgi:predicted DNA binding CopG/RHH family protein